MNFLFSCQDTGFPTQNTSADVRAARLRKGLWGWRGSAQVWDLLSGAVSSAGHTEGSQKQASQIPPPSVPVVVTGMHDA